MPERPAGEVPWEILFGNNVRNVVQHTEVLDADRSVRLKSIVEATWAVRPDTDAAGTELGDTLTSLD